MVRPRSSCTSRGATRWRKCRTAPCRTPSRLCGAGRQMDVEVKLHIPRSDTMARVPDGAESDSVGCAARDEQMDVEVKLPTPRSDTLAQVPGRRRVGLGRLCGARTSRWTSRSSCTFREATRWRECRYGAESDSVGCAARDEHDGRRGQVAHPAERHRWRECRMAQNRTSSNPNAMAG